MPLRRLWVCTKLVVDAGRVATTRPTEAADDPAIAMLLSRAYVDTIDDDPTHSFERELQTWRSIDQADDASSRLAFDGSEIVSACLIAREFGVPLLYEIATDPAAKQRGLASALLGESMTALHACDEKAVLAWVTEGNIACERLLDGLGFVAATSGLGPTVARSLYAEIARVSSDELPAWLLNRPRREP